MKRIAAVTAAAVMVFGVTAYLPCSRVSAAEGEECFADRGVFFAADDGHPTDEESTDEEGTADEDIGDVNGDGKVNVADISVTAAHIKGVMPLEGARLAAADVNADGSVNITDLSQIVGHVKGKGRLLNSVCRMYDSAVGKRLADLDSDSYDLSWWPKNQCTWYCIGRTIEKQGIDLTEKNVVGNAIQWYAQAKAVSPDACGTKIRSDSVCVLSSWTHGYGHVVYIEYVDDATGAIYYSQANKLGWNTVLADNGKIEKAENEADFIAKMNWLYLSVEGYVYPDKL